jgi:hypothetical protein
MERQAQFMLKREATLYGHLRKKESESISPRRTNTTSPLLEILHSILPPLIDQVVKLAAVDGTLTDRKD